MTILPFDTAELTRFGPHYTGDGRRYLLRLPATDKAKGRTRATTFAKTIDDESNLAPWGETMGIVGVLTDRPTRTEWQALLAEHPDPWYAGPEAKERARDLAKQAKEAGGAGDRRDTGTALHTILHLIATGRAQPDAVDEEWRAHVVNALTVLAEAGLRIVPELCELTVFNRIYDTIGRFDLIVETLDDRYGIPKGTLCIADWKTGGATWRPKKDYKTKRQTGWYDGYDMSDGPHVGQLTLYASASDIVIWPEDKWDECRLIPMPVVSQQVGFIIHLPSNEPGNVTVRVLDLTIGRQWLDTCRLVRDTRKCKPLIGRVGAHEPPVPEIVPSSVSQPVDPFDGLTSTLVEQQVVPAPNNQEDGWSTASASSTSDTTSTGSEHSSNTPKETLPQATSTTSATTSNESANTSTTSTRSSSPTADPARRAWIIDRLTVLQAVDGALARVGILWPDSTPTLKQSDSHTDDMYDAIVAVIDLVEAEYTIPFGTPDPTKETSSPRQSETFSKTPSTESNPALPTHATSSATSPTPVNRSEPPANTSTTSSTSSPDEGPDVDPDTVKALETKYSALDDAGRAWIAGIAHDAQQAGRPIHLSTPTLRRFEIVRGLVALAAGGYADDEITRALVRLTLTDEYPVLTAPLATGAVVAGLGPAMAQRFARNCQAFCDGDIAMHIDDNNTIRLTPTTKGK